MAKSTSAAAMVALIMAALLLAGGREAEAQSDCASKLVACAEYLNSTKPSADCCSAMKDVVTTQLPCLCGLLKNPDLLGGINMTQALELPKYCNIPGDTSACNAVAQTPGSSALPPPATPGGNGGSNGGTVSQIGLPFLVLATAFSCFY